MSKHFFEILAKIVVGVNKIAGYPSRWNFEILFFLRRTPESFERFRTLSINPSEDSPESVPSFVTKNFLRAMRHVWKFFFWKCSNFIKFLNLEQKFRNPRQENFDRKLNILFDLCTFLFELYQWKTFFIEKISFLFRYLRYKNYDLCMKNLRLWCDVYFLLVRANF